VVKVGGSLFSEVPRLVQEITGAGRPVLVVPGGGQYADLIRMLQLPEEQSHWMAIAAMEQFGWYIAVHGMETVDEIGTPEGVRVLLPYRVMRIEDPLPHTWDVTSDSIAAWVAQRLGLPLLLLKAVEGLTRDGILQARVAEPYPCREVDPYFLPYVLSQRIPVMVANGRVAGRTAAWLRGEEVPGTVIGRPGNTRRSTRLIGWGGGPSQSTFPHQGRAQREGAGPLPDPPPVRIILSMVIPPYSDQTEEWRPDRD